MTDYREPTWKGRLILAGLSVLGVILGVVSPLWIKPYLAHLDTLPLCDSLPPLRWFVLGMLASSWAVGVLVARAALRTFRSRESPFPGALVWFRTPIRRGWRAAVDAAIMALMAAFLIVGPVVAFFSFEANIIFCWPEACGC